MMRLTRTALKELTKKYRSVLKKCAILNAMMLMFGVSSALAVEPSAYTLTEVGETGNWNYYDTVNGTKKYYQITPKNGTHYKVDTEGTTFSIKSIKPGTDSYSYQVTPQGTSEERVAKDSFTKTIGTEGAPVVFHSIDVDPGDPDKGGAVYNYNNTEGHSIYADFVLNKTTNYGGGVRNGYKSSAFIDKIVGNFVKNKAGTVGGAIANGADCSDTYTTVINEIIGNFIGNTANRGGAIYNQRTIGKITGDFLSNNSNETGGAITNTDIGTIGNTTDNTSGIFGNFVSNSSINGGAISNEGTINGIEGDFILNTATTNGGAINNIGTLIINGSTFTENHAENDTLLQGKGGAIYNAGTLTITGTNTFSGNEALEFGGAIYNYTYSNINSLTGDFTENSARAGGGAIYNDGTIDNITGDFSSNSAAYGGAIYNYTNTTSRIDSITGDFISNSAQEDGGAIFNRMSNTIGSITGDFMENSAKNGGAIHNAGSIIGINNSTFTNNTATEYGGAIYNNGEIYIKDSTFTGNVAKAGGAIYNDNGVLQINIVADDKNIIFSNNYITSSDSKGGAIYNDGTLGLYANDGKTITFTGGEETTDKYNIDGIYNDSTYTAVLNINGNETGTPTTGTVNLYTVNGQGTTNIYGGTVSVKGAFEQNTLDINSDAILDLAKGQINSVTVDTLKIADGVKLRFDVDNTQNDKFIATNITTTANDNGIIIDSINMMSDFTGDSITLFNDGTTGTVSLAGKIAATKTYYNGKLYTFTQDTTEYGKLNVAGNPISWTIQDVIGAQTFTDTERTILVKDINTYSMSGDKNLTTDLGLLKRYTDTDPRTLTINGNGYVLNGQNTVSGIEVNSGDTLTLNNVTMQNFKKESGIFDNGAAINNEATITSITGNFKGNHTDSEKLPVVRFIIGTAKLAL